MVDQFITESSYSLIIRNGVSEVPKNAPLLGVQVLYSKTDSGFVPCFPALSGLLQTSQWFTQPLFWSLHTTLCGITPFLSVGKAFPIRNTLFPSSLPQSLGPCYKLS